MKNISHRYDINKPSKICLSIMMAICIKQHLSNIWSLIHEKISNTEAELKKTIAYKKACNLLNKK